MSSVLMRCISSLSAASPSSPESCLRRSSSPSSSSSSESRLRSSPISSASSRSCTASPNWRWSSTTVLEPVEIAPGAVLDQRTPEIDQLLGRRRRRHAGQALAHQKRQRVLDRRVGALGDLVEFAAVEFLVEHGGQILGDAVHAPRADRLDARLLDRLEHRARLLAGRLQAAMHRRIVAGKAQRDRIGMAAHDRGLAAAELARRLRQADLAAHQAGTLGGEGDLQLRLARDGAQAAGDRALERLGRRVLRRRFAFDVGGHARLHSRHPAFCRAAPG